MSGSETSTLVFLLLLLAAACLSCWLGYMSSGRGVGARDA